MQIKIADNIGFCNGVLSAIEKAKMAKQMKEIVYTYGDLIHNKKVIDSLFNQGIVSIKDLSMLKTHDTIIISAHGVPLETQNEMEERGLDVIDATCNFVKNIHKKVAYYSAMGFAIVIFGNDNHPEVKGIKGYCKKCYVINDENTFPEIEEDNILGVVQTTFNHEKYIKIKEKFIIYAKNASKRVVFFDSICYTTMERQWEAKLIASQCDLVLVIGDTASSNANKLFNICKNECVNSYLIENVNDVKSLQNKNIAKLGIVSSASAPKELIMEVLNTMVEEFKANQTTAEETAKTNDEATNEVAEESTQNETAQAEETAVVEQAPVEEKATETHSEDIVKATVNATSEEENGFDIEDIKIELPNIISEKAQEKAPAKEKSEENMSMAEALKKFSPKSYRAGMKVKVIIDTVDQSGLSVAIVDGGSGKNDSGFIDKDEVEADGDFNPQNYKKGDYIDAIIIPKEQDSKAKSINLSKKAYEQIKIDDEKAKKILEGEEFTLACNREIKGGLLGKIGSYTIFVPASQIRMGYVKNLSEYVNKPLRLKMLPPKDEVVEDGEKKKANPKRIVASQRIVFEEEKKLKEDEFWDNLNVDTVVQGKVKRFSTFGAFVSVNGFDCLAHISDLSWTKIDKPSDVLEINKSYDFLVLRVDRANNKVSIGFKQLQKQPYELAAEKYPVGSVVKGKVERIKPYGAFIEIEPGVDGLVHVSQIGYKWIKDASEALKEGDEVEAKIIGFDNNKITLSIKELLPVPEEEVQVELEEEEIQEGEEKKSRVDKFKRRASQQDDRDAKPGRKKEKTVDDTPREYVSSSSGATFADVFKDLNLSDFED